MNRAVFRGVEIVGASPDELTHVVLEAARSHRGLLLTFVNPHSFNLLADDRGPFRQDLARMDLRCVDGIGVVWAVRALVGRKLARLSFDLWAPTLLASVADASLPVFLVGGRPGVADAAATAIAKSHPALSIVGTHHGFVRDDEIDELAGSVVASGAALVLVGAGAPRQERLAVALGSALPNLVIATCGGYFDQVSRPTPYYPSWAYPLRLNWVVRLYREPARLWRRYLIGNPRFVAESIRWRIRGSRR